MKRKTWYLGRYSWVILLLWFSACGRPTSDETAVRSTAMSPSLTPVRSGAPLRDAVSSLSLTPTPRAFRNAKCSAADVGGHIFFLHGNGGGKRNRASYYDLYVMDGNGCLPGFVMPEVSGSPAWSTDGTRLAIGCENNVSLCVLDIKATLNTCTGPQNQVGQCRAVVLRQYRLPSTIGGDERMYNVAWSPDSSQIAVEGGSEVTHQYFVYLLTLADGGTWKILLQGLQVFDIAWSPTGDQLAYSGLSFLNLQSTNIAVGGFAPAWAPDGKRIAFVKASDDDNKEPYGIAVVGVNGGNWEWLYEPEARDAHYYPPQNLVVRDDGYYHRLLSWSPDARHIAFVSEIGLGAESHIFRLDTVTGEIVNLTSRLIPDQGARVFYAPAWGP